MATPSGSSTEHRSLVLLDIEPRRDLNLSTLISVDRSLHLHQEADHIFY